MTSRDPTPELGEASSHPESGGNRALAASHTWHLLGTLFLEGVCERTLPFLERLEPFAEALDAMRRRHGGRIDLDEAAADHHDVLGSQVFPYEGVFLDPSAHVGAETTASVRAAYEAAGFPIASHRESADHIGVELIFMSFLARVEADASDHAMRHRARRHQRDFLRGHLLRWLPLLDCALQDVGHGLYVCASEIALELALDRLRSFELHTDSARCGRTHDTPDLPPVPSILDDPDTRLRDISAHLLTPAYTGFFLSRAAIRRLARRHEAPAGFGPRRQMLTNLLRSAVEYEVWHQVLSDIRSHAARYEGQLEARRIDAGVIAELLDAWTDRLRATRRMLECLGEAAETVTADLD